MYGTGRVSARSAGRTGGPEPLGIPAALCAALRVPEGRTRRAPTAHGTAPGAGRKRPGRPVAPTTDPADGSATHLWPQAPVPPCGQPTERSPSPRRHGAAPRRRRVPRPRERPSWRRTPGARHGRRRESAPDGRPSHARRERQGPRRRSARALPTRAPDAALLAPPGCIRPSPLGRNVDERQARHRRTGAGPAPPRPATTPSRPRLCDVPEPRARCPPGRTPPLARRHQRGPPSAPATAPSGMRGRHFPRRSPSPGPDAAGDHSREVRRRMSGCSLRSPQPSCPLAHRRSPPEVRPPAPLTRFA